MSDSRLADALSKLGLNFRGHFNFGVGLASKVVAFGFVCVLGAVAIAIFAPPDAPDMFFYVLLGFGFLVIVGTWVNAALNPLSALEGKHYLEAYNRLLAAKDQLEPPPDSPVILNPEYRELSPRSEDDDGA